MNCRLLYLIGQLRPGGSERQLYYLLRSVDRERYRPAVVVWNFSESDIYVPQIRALGVPLYAFPGILSAAAKLRAFRRLVKQLEPEVVHSYSFYTNFAASWAAWYTQAVAVGSVRSDFARAKKDTGLWLGKLSAYWPRDQIYNSSLAVEAARRSRSLSCPKRLYIIRNSLDLERFYSTPLAPGGKIRIVGVGSLLPVKRWDRLLRAALTLKGHGLKFLVRIIGDGPLRRSLEQQAGILGVADCVEFIGHSDNVQDLLADAKFLVHTSDSEGCPNVVMEAMACGRAVVATDAGDVPDLVEDGKTGFVVHRGDDAMLADRMVTLITNYDMCRRMGEAGRAKAEREFGLDRLVSETLAAYQSIGWKDS